MRGRSIICMAIGVAHAAFPPPPSPALAVLHLERQSAFPAVPCVDEGSPSLPNSPQSCESIVKIAGCNVQEIAFACRASCLQCPPSMPQPPSRPQSPYLPPPLLPPTFPKLVPAHLQGDLGFAARGSAYATARHVQAVSRPLEECVALARTQSPDFDLCRNLSGADLRYLDLSGAKLNYCNLTGALLDHANLDRASIYAVDGTGASFENSSLFRAKLDRSILKNADFSGSYMEFAKLQELVGFGAKFDGSNMRGCDLDRSDFTEASFKQVDLRYGHMTAVVVNNADFTASDLRGANIRSLYDAYAVTFDKVNLEGTIITDCHFHYASWEDARLERTRWEDTQFNFGYFNGASWKGASMSDIGFEGAILDNVLFDFVSLDQTRFRGASLNFASFRGSYLKEADLRGIECLFCEFETAKLTLASLDGAALQFANFDSADITDSNFVGAKVDQASFTNTVGHDKADFSDVIGNPINLACDKPCCACRAGADLKAKTSTEMLFTAHNSYHNIDKTTGRLNFGSALLAHRVRAGRPLPGSG
eukprot:CAMPEP_0119300466 /NCGR_PEP_ID=MMETSP1333-20130426/2404_1 /TAXON_ID=418940 /ORGANISM="Scyphosphaera apsteinii, Strain RCC1455" /LENGTH=535 /DNA_ID=CAMNT_0007302243 /DNA_START=38 /DNA_END=1645 /DNA_ORIENTATION=-